MKCHGCNKELKRPSVSGYGPVCERKMNRLNASGDADRSKIRILINTKNQRSYQVGSFVVEVLEDNSGNRTATCWCSTAGCEHIAKVAQIEDHELRQLAPIQI